MADNLGPGLSDFGLSAPSESNSVGGQEPLEALLGGGLGNSQLDDVAREKILRERLGELANAEGPSFWDRLKSPEGLVALAGTLGVGLSGGGLEGAAGFGLGAAGGLREGQAAWESQRRAAMDKVQEQVDDNVERQLKRNQMFSTALQNAPDLFTDPETGELSAPPELLGYFAYGMPIAANPSSKRLNARRDARWEAQVDFLSTALEEVGTVEDAAKLIDHMNVLLGATNNDPELNMSLARAMGTENWDAALVGHYIRYAGSTAKEALLHAAENGLPPTHPEVVKRLDFGQGADSLPPSQRLNERFIDLMDKVKEWEANPANAQLVAQIRKEGETPEERRRLTAEQALINSADVAFYEDEMGSMPSYEARRLQAQYAANASGWDLAMTVVGAGRIGEVQGMSPEERRTAIANETLAELRADEQAIREDQAKSTVGKANTEAGRIVSGLNVSYEAASRTVQQSYQLARQQLGPDATQEQIDVRVQALVTAYINTYKQ